MQEPIEDRAGDDLIGQDGAPIAKPPFQVRMIEPR
jgi:hypothetical protein